MEQYQVIIDGFLFVVDLTEQEKKALEQDGAKIERNESKYNS